MARDLIVAWAGRHQRSAWETLMEGYRKRLGRWARIQDRPVRASKASEDRRCQLEGEALLATAPDPCWGIALDSGGKTLSSEDFSKYMTRLHHEWPHPIVFFIGSDLGLHSAVTEKCRLVLSFGPMTLPHELARLVLYEQIYRALSIEKGINYHRPRL